MLSLLHEEQVEHHLIFYPHLSFIIELYRSSTGLTFIITILLPLLYWPRDDLLRASSVNFTARSSLFRELVSFMSILPEDPK